jgi:hypothetical protein
MLVRTNNSFTRQLIVTEGLINILKDYIQSLTISDENEEKEWLISMITNTVLMLEGIGNDYPEIDKFINIEGVISDLLE